MKYTDLVSAQYLAQFAGLVELLDHVRVLRNGIKRQSHDA